MAELAEQLATVIAWDDASGIGRLARDLGLGGEDEIDRAKLAGATELGVGQRVAFVEAYERGPDDESGWTIRSVRAVDDAAFWAEVLERLCRDAEWAETDLRVATEVASEEDVDSARDAWKRADEHRKKRLPEIGLDIYARGEWWPTARLPEIGSSIYARGGESAMRAVLDRVDQEHRSVVADGWRGIFENLRPI